MYCALFVAGDGSDGLEFIDWRRFTRQHGHLVAAVADPVADRFLEMDTSRRHGRKDSTIAIDCAIAIGGITLPL